MPFLLKRVLFRLHWLSGLLGGLVLMVVGVTGGLLSYEAELLAWLNPQHQLEAAGRQRLPIDGLISRAQAAHPELRVLAVAANGGPAAPLEVRLGQPGQRGGEQVLVDPYRGDLLPPPRGAGFFHTSEELHRFLAAGPLGMSATGARLGARDTIAPTLRSRFAQPSRR